VADSSDERLSRGMKTALQLFTPKDGAPRPPSFRYPKEIAEAWNKLSIATVMGDVWGREELDPQRRALITIGVLTALDKPNQLRQYITGGLNLGLTREEICEAILHVSVYAGFPAAIQGFQVANEVFDEQDAASE
jgi:4-carboxymuconolactone decarboxylase